MNRRRFLGVAGLAWITGGQAAEDRKARLARFPPREEWMALDPLRETWTKVRGLSMFSLVSIDAVPPGAPAMVLVHGSGLSGQYMIPSARELARDFRVFVPDMPGYGNSGDPGKVLNVPELADWLAAWMPSVDLKQASFLGNSFGCQVIADLAARYPARVEKAVLQGPTTPPDERSGFWQFIRWRQNQRYNPDWLGDVTMEDYRKAGLWRMIRSFRFQITDRIEDKAPFIQAPVLVIRGAEDPIASQEFCELIVRRCRRGQLVIIPEVAHTLVFTAPAPLAEATCRFVMEAPAGPDAP